MPNIGALLKDEISRLSRKEARRQATPLKKISAQQRRLIAALRKQVSSLESRLKALASQAGKASAGRASADDAADGGKAPRFQAKGLRTLRKRLGLSAADLGKLVGVTGQSVYNWEQGKAKPRRTQIAALAALRSAGKKAVLARLSDAPAEAPAPAAKRGKPGRKPRVGRVARKATRKVAGKRKG
jgi:DNA-binding transcriptional regulator YiaG